MSLPRFFAFCSALLLLGAAGSRFEFRMNAQDKELASFRAEVKDLRDSNKELAQAITALQLAIAGEPPEIDYKGRIKK